MTNRATDLAPSDLNDAAADGYERRQTATAAVRTALASVTLLTLLVDENRCATGSQAHLAAELAELDARECGRLLTEAERQLGLTDPLGDVDNSADHDALATARGEWRAALYALGLDVLTLAPAALAKAG